jgi:DNA adenine methylase
MYFTLTPYQGVSGSRDQRYFSGLPVEELIFQLERLNDLGLPFVLSYDGRLGDKSYGVPLPPSLDLRRMELCAGRSASSTLLGEGLPNF